MIQNDTHRETPRDWLIHEYTQRVKRNPYYSQRAFASLIGLSSGRLSDILGGKRHLGARSARRIAERLAFPPLREQAWVELVSQSRATRNRSVQVQSLLNTEVASNDYEEMSHDVYASIADWYHLAILDLMATVDFSPNSRWIARRLGIQEQQARNAWTRLKRLGFIKKDGEHWIRVKPRLKTTQDVPSSAIRSAHKQTLGLAVIALDDVPVEDRDITYMTLAISVSKIGAIKKAIRNFRRTITDLMDAGEKDEVYNLNIAFFPLTVRRRSG